MIEKDKLMKKIQMYDFCIQDIVLYLDSHPLCKSGLAYYKKYKEMLKAAKEEYVCLYGPISVYDVECDSKWTWVEGKWPWEMEENY